MKTRRKIIEWLGKRKTLVKVLAAMVVIGLFLGGTFVMQAASAHKAWIASYADGMDMILKIEFIPK